MCTSTLNHSTPRRPCRRVPLVYCPRHCTGLGRRVVTRESSHVGRRHRSGRGGTPTAHPLSRGVSPGPSERRVTETTPETLSEVLERFGVEGSVEPIETRPVQERPESSGSRREDQSILSSGVGGVRTEGGRRRDSGRKSVRLLRVDDEIMFLLVLWDHIS